MISGQRPLMQHADNLDLVPSRATKHHVAALANAPGARSDSIRGIAQGRVRADLLKAGVQFTEVAIPLLDAPALLGIAADLLDVDLRSLPIP